MNNTYNHSRQSDGTLRRANETAAMFVPRAEALADRKLFVQQLGVLLSQTREGVESATLDDKDIVTVRYKNGHEIYVNVDMDSYADIERDVMKHVV